MPRETVTTKPPKGTPPRKTLKAARRDKMRSVMNVWSGKKSIEWMAAFNKTSVEIIEEWCKTAIAGGKQALGDRYGKN